jgi:hypothetical protein
MDVNWAYIFQSPKSNPATDRLVIHREGVRSTLVAVPDTDAAERVAVELVQSGVKAIELCGMFGVAAAAKILQAIEGKAAVGCVTFASDSTMKMIEAFVPSKG